MLPNGGDTNDFEPSAATAKDTKQKTSESPLKLPQHFCCYHRCCFCAAIDVRKMLLPLLKSLPSTLSLLPQKQLWNKTSSSNKDSLLLNDSVHRANSPATAMNGRFQMLCVKYCSTVQTSKLKSSEQRQQCSRNFGNHCLHVHCLRRQQPAACHSFYRPAARQTRAFA